MHVLLLIFRKGHLTDNVYEKYANNVLSDTELRWFWISWLNGVISYGRGSHVGLDAIGSYVDKSPSPVNYMSVSSYDTVRGYWVIPSELYQTPGKCCLVFKFTGLRYRWPSGPEPGPCQKLSCSLNRQNASTRQRTSLRIDWPMFNCCSHGTLLHFSLQSSRLNCCILAIIASWGLWKYIHLLNTPDGSKRRLVGKCWFHSYFCKMLVYLCSESTKIEKRPVTEQLNLL